MADVCEDENDSAVSAKEWQAKHLSTYKESPCTMEALAHA